MKKYVFYLALILICGFFFSCSNDMKIPAPQWIVTENPGYNVTMTAVVSVPRSVGRYEFRNNKLAAFVGDECRGIGMLFKEDEKASADIYFISIRGASEEQKKVSFMYYSNAFQLVYTSGEVIDFEPDYVYGSVDEPKELDLKKVRNK